MLDSGCSIDLIGLGDLSRDERELIVQNAKLSLRTANGKTNTRGLAHVRVKGIEELLEAYVLDSTPSLLSLGKRCMELGYRFVWEPFTRPKFYDPRGRRITVEVINHVPYLVPSETEIVAGRTDLPRIYPALPAPIVVYRHVGFLPPRKICYSTAVGLGGWGGRVIACTSAESYGIYSAFCTCGLLRRVSLPCFPLLECVYLRGFLRVKRRNVMTSSENFSPGMRTCSNRPGRISLNRISFALHRLPWTIIRTPAPCSLCVPELTTCQPDLLNCKLPLQ